MSWFKKYEKPRKREKQAKIPKIPKNHNGSKPIAGKHTPIFKKAKDLVD